MIRTLVERLCRGRKIIRRLPPRLGGIRFYVSPDAQLKYLKIGESAFDSQLLKVAESI